MAPMEAGMDLAEEAGALVTWEEAEAGEREEELEELLGTSPGATASSSGAVDMVSRIRATEVAMAKDMEALVEAVEVAAPSVGAEALEAEVR